MSSPLFEVCLDDIDAVSLARNAGAFSIELAANLSIGGTTPSVGMIGTALENAGPMTVHVMVRLRPGEFVYTPSEMYAMIQDVRTIRRSFSDMDDQLGFVLGPLTPDGKVDRESLSRFVGAAGGCPVTFHKAFDATRDLFESLAILKEAGVQRVLTSGGRRLLIDGEAVLTELALLAAGDIVILAAGEGAPRDVRVLLQRTGIEHYHFVAQKPSPSLSHTQNPELGFDSGWRATTNIDLIRHQMALIRQPRSEPGESTH